MKPVKARRKSRPQRKGDVSAPRKVLIKASKSKRGKKRPKLVSPESYFIRTGEMPQSLDPSRAKRLGSKFLSMQWYEGYKKKARAGHTTNLLPLPTDRQRLRGGSLPKAERQEVRRQLDFLVDAFTTHLPMSQRRLVRRHANRMFPGRMLAINSALRGFTRGRNLNAMREAGVELYSDFRSSGAIWDGVMQETPKGKTYVAKGTLSVQSSKSSPAHEGIHILQKLGVIRYDIPYATTVERLWDLEHGLRRVNPNLRAPTAKEFEWIPRPDGRVKAIKTHFGEGLRLSYDDREKSYSYGRRMGQWVYQNLSPSQRWRYVYLRTMGKSHREALGTLRGRRA